MAMLNAIGKGLCQVAPISHSHLSGFLSHLYKRVACVIALIALSVAGPGESHAQSNSLPIVRDAEIEKLLNDYMRPLLAAANIRRNRVEVVLVNSRSFNAFVSGRKIFVNLGAIVTAETPNELIGVLAHEIGHLAGGHQDRLRQQIDRAKTIAVVTALLGVSAAIAAGSAGNNQLAGAGAGIAAGSSELAKRGLLSYQRTEELAADRAALTYLNKTKQSTKGILTTFKRFDKSLALVRDRVNPYKISHPLPRERIAALETLAKQSPYFNKKDPAALQTRHDKARAKILAYTYGPGAVEGALGKSNNSVQYRYGRAISTFLYKNPRAAIPMIDALIKGAPKNPYYHEIKGEALLRAQNADGAVKAFSRAVQLDGARSPTMLAALGHALVLNGRESDLRRAVGELEVALSIDPDNPRAYRHLAMAYGRLGDTSSANLATAEEHFHSGRYKSAKQFAARAKRGFNRNTPQWLRADDILKFKTRN